MRNTTQARRSIHLASLLAAGLVTAPSLFGQVALQPLDIARLVAREQAAQPIEVPPELKTALVIDSGNQPGERSGDVVVWSRLVTLPNTAWLRLHFGALDLQAGSTIRMTSMLDFETQTFNASDAEMWSNSSAYFNGHEVLLELVAGAETTANRVQLAAVSYETSGGGGGMDYICGIGAGDDRYTPSQYGWAARIGAGGCSSAMFSPLSVFVTAAHCNVTSGAVIQFNVPPSLPNCNTVNAAVNDQFPVGQYLKSTYPGFGNDWGVFQVGTNGLGQKPYQRYGVYRAINSTVPAYGTFCQSWGFGADSGGPECVKQYTLQLGPGNILATSSPNTITAFTSDVQGGSSGSALIVNGGIVAVITHCEPTAAHGGGWGTNVNHPGFVAARNMLNK